MEHVTEAFVRCIEAIGGAAGSEFPWPLQVPQRLAAQLIWKQRIKEGETMGRVQSRRRIALIVEDDAELRLLTTMVLEESELDIIECESAEAALANMLLRGQDAVMIFADIRLSGEMNGIDLAREVKMRWPHLVVILTSGNAGEHLKQLPPGVDYMPKPWQPLNVLMAAERARSSAGGR